jgi:hypothetical protein
MNKNQKIKSITGYLKKMSEAVKKLDSMPKQQAKEESIRSLQSTGVLTKSGAVKKSICTVHG